MILILPSTFATVVETIPTGSIVGTMVASMAFFCFIGYLFLKVDEDNKKKEGWNLIAILFFTFAGFMFNLLTFFIMEFSKAESYYIVTRAIFVISSIIFGFGGAILTFVVSITSVIFFLTATVIGKNEKEKRNDESRS